MDSHMMKCQCDLFKLELLDNLSEPDGEKAREWKGVLSLFKTL